jgi:uncharacterized protein (DUF3084 family)
MTYFDSLGFAQELKKVDFRPDQAEVLASLIRDHVLGNTAKKEDLANTESRFNGKIENTEHRLNEHIDRVEERITSELKQLEQRMTIKLGSMMVVAVGVVVAAQKLW